MKRLMAAVILVLLVAGYIYAVDSGSIPASQQPVVKEVIGKGDIWLEAALYPEFRPMNVDPRTDNGCKTADSRVFQTLNFNQSPGSLPLQAGRSLLIPVSSVNRQRI